MTDGKVTSTLGGYQVLFNGIPAPLLYASPYQINAIVPNEIAGAVSVSIAVTGPQGTTAFPSVFVAALSPCDLCRRDCNRESYYAAALNQDGTENSAANPARPGTIVTIWASGLGIPIDTPQDGTIIEGSSYGTPQVSILAHDSLEILYAGYPPGLVFGVAQINFRLPAQFPPAPTPPFIQPFGIRLQVGEVVGPITYIYANS